VGTKDGPDDKQTRGEVRFLDVMKN
jgi:hypothetical protein